MMQLLVLGINHATASVGLREKLAIAPEQQMHALESLSQRLLGSDDSSEVVILSTCNRTELVIAAGSATTAAAVLQEDALDWLAHYCNTGRDSFEQHMYRHSDEAALNHLLQVGSGLDSMVLGEPQILGQLKSAYAASRKVDAIGGLLEPVFQHMFSVVKRVRSSTAIGENPVSVAYAAVMLAQRIFSDLSEVSVLLIGAGETIELVGKHIRQVGVNEMTIANRTIDNATELAESLACHAMLLADIPAELQRFDVVISSTGSQLPILGKGAVEQALDSRRRRPMFLVDIAVPRDIEPQVAELADAYLYSIDDLKDIIDHNLQLRAQEADRAREIIAEGVAEFRLQRQRRSGDELVVAYRQRVDAIGEAELARALQQLRAGEPAEQVLNAFAHSLKRKIMHEPTVGMRDAAAQQDTETLQAARRLLGLDDS